MKTKIQAQEQSLALKGELLINDGQSQRRSYLRYPVMLALVLGLVFAAAASNSVKADPIGLTPTPPDISALNLALTFNSSANSFVVTGSAPNSFFLFTNANNVSSNISNGNYVLNATLNSLGAFSGGTFTIMGNGGTLLTGALTSFGFSSSTIGQGTFEFTFNTISSNSALGFGPNGGIILTSTDLGPGPSSWCNFMGTASANTFSTAASVPEPTSIVLLSLGGLGLVGKLRRRNRK